KTSWDCRKSCQNLMQLNLAARLSRRQTTVVARSMPARRVQNRRRFFLALAQANWLNFKTTQDAQTNRKLTAATRMAMPARKTVVTDRMRIDAVHSNQRLRYRLRM